MSIQDRATRPGRFSKLLMSFYEGYDIDVAASIAVGLEVNIEDCDAGTILELTDDDEYPISNVLAEEPAIDIHVVSPKDSHLRCLV